MIFSNCIVHSHSTIVDSLLLPECEEMEQCKIRGAIIERGAIFPEGRVIGVDLNADRGRGFRVTEGGHTLVNPEILNQNLHVIR